MSLRYAICSEIFQGWELAKACSTARALGYEGLEIAHFHLFDDVRTFGPAERAEMRRIIESEGMVCSGLHWLMVSPKGFHITTEDGPLREKSWDYLAHLIEFCGDMGGPVMILGSPYQRSAPSPELIPLAEERLIEGLERLADVAEDRGVTILMEAVPSPDTNVCTRLADAARIVHSVGHPAIQTMFDTHNTADETEPMAVLLERHWPIIKHIHVNEMNGLHPGTSGLDFEPVIRHLVNHDYKGWVSLEVFNFEAGAERIGRESIEFLKGIEDRVRNG